MLLSPLYNLTEVRWIPVRYLNHLSSHVGLIKLFREADQIADLECAPHERVSLMRLLVCITQAVLGAPDDSDGWDDFGEDFEEKICAYLTRPDIAPHFNLFGDGPRFLQIKTASQSDPTPASKLIPHLATGNNPTLNDHKGADSERKLPPHKLGLALLTFQNFYPLYGAGYKGKGPCVDSNMAHTFLKGTNLRETVILNCLDHQLINEQFTRRQMGRPVWELDLSEKEGRDDAVEAYLGRLVPRHRSVQLTSDGSGFFLDQESLVYPAFEESREPSCTITLRKAKDSAPEERRLVSARLDHGLWRDLHLFTILRESNKEIARAPLTLHSHRSEGIRQSRLWVGGLITDLKAKIHDTVESTFTVPPEMFDPIGRLKYESGVNFAEVLSNKLYGAVMQYGASLKNESPPVSLAKRQYWTALDQDSSILLDIVRNPEFHNTSFEEDPNLWSSTVKRAAYAAFDFACPRQTPRQFKAYSAGLRVLRSTKSVTKKKS